VKLNYFGPTFGDMYLYYNDSNGYNCAFTEKLIDRGIPAVVPASDGLCVSDSGNYKCYASPVYLYVPHTCIRWGCSATAQDGREDSYWSPGNTAADQSVPHGDGEPAAVTMRDEATAPYAPCPPCHPS
jgi:hypothetical protein